MPTYDYMSTEPQCSLWRDTEGHCCPDGTHEKGCVYAQEREARLVKPIHFALVGGCVAFWAFVGVAIWWLTRANT